MIGIKEFNKKIGSLKNTRKITKTMKMVSAAKFKRAYKAQSNAQEYAQKLKELIGSLAGFADNDNPLLNVKSIKKNKVLVVVFTSDKGLCGGFNNNLIRSLRRWLDNDSNKANNIDLSFCGRRGHMAFRRTSSVKKFYEDITIKPNFTDAQQVAKEITDAFIANEYDEVYLAYNYFKSPLSQLPTIEKLLPLDTATLVSSTDKISNTDYLYEPKQVELFSLLLPKFLNFKLFYTLLENAAGEHGARMAAMDKATSNTADLIDRYTLLRNRARQTAITTELIEIISGAQALE